MTARNRVGQQGQPCPPANHPSRTTEENRRDEHERGTSAAQNYAPSAGAAASAFFLGVDFFGAAFLLATFFLVASGLVVVLAMRPDLVRLRTVGFSVTAGAWRLPP